ncbi:hypothetical protein [Ideonella sp. A 288]|uniref:hypothetical protein n=1 Tax=Ideonella sp. A 288 TaxID=1962181 RepID=UPI0018FE21B4|nr:hypothetical protein [Ideonella sp. A 288]
MTLFRRLALWGTALATLGIAGVVAHATNYSLWINGRTGGGQVGNHADFRYWGPAATAAGVNKKSVNWDGYNRISTTNGGIRDALDCYCTGPNWCYIAAHSAGNLQIGYALALYGSSSRLKKNATPNASGQCGNSDGSSQVGWNIKWVDVAGGAGGGSELADAGDWALTEPLVSDLKTSSARALYNHNATGGRWFYMFAGSKGTLYSFVLPGQDDEAIAYHSSGGVSGASGASFCNPADWLCNDLTLGSAANQGGRAKWSFHSVAFRDDAEALNHYTNGNWGGIVSRVRADMAANAL